VRDGVQEGILALVAADFADQENGVQYDACGEHGEEDDAQDDGGDAAPIQQYPGDVVGGEATDEEGAEGDR